MERGARLKLHSSALDPSTASVDREIGGRVRMHFEMLSFKPHCSRLEESANVTISRSRIKPRSSRLRGGRLKPHCPPRPAEGPFTISFAVEVRLKAQTVLILSRTVRRFGACILSPTSRGAAATRNRLLKSGTSTVSEA